MQGVRFPENFWRKEGIFSVGEVGDGVSASRRRRQVLKAAAGREGGRSPPGAGGGAGNGAAEREAEPQRAPQVGTSRAAPAPDQSGPPSALRRMRGNPRGSLEKVVRPGAAAEEERRSAPKPLN